MTSGHLIVLERDGHWATALRRELAATSVRLIETRSWDDCWQRLVEFPAALVAAELTDSNVGQTLAAISRLEREFPAAALVVLAERRLAMYRGLLREGGAIHFLTSPRRLGEVADILARSCGKLSTTPVPTGRIDEILADLPWSDSVE